MNDKTKVIAGDYLRTALGDAIREWGPTKLSRRMHSNARTLLSAIARYPLEYGRLKHIKDFLTETGFLSEADLKADPACYYLPKSKP